MRHPKNIVLSSVLKPVNDTRLYAKIGGSLHTIFHEANLHFVAYPASQSFETTSSREHFHPFNPFPRLSLQRIFCNWHLLIWLFRIRPELVVISTFELLPSAFIYCLFFWKTRLVYDVRENYAYNLRYGNSFSRSIGYLLSLIVRLLERLVAWRVSAYWLAERCYAQEMTFMKSKSLILENKFLQSALPEKANKNQKGNREDFNLVYTGTISGDYGIFKLLDWYEYQKEYFSNLKLTIIGFASNQTERKILTQRLISFPEIQLIGGEKLVPHQEILVRIANADAAVLPYNLTKNIQRRLPTKFYECLHLCCPMIVQKHQFWEEFLGELPVKSASFIDFAKPETTQIEEFQNKTFFKDASDSLDIYWEGQMSALSQNLQQMFS